MSPSTTRPPDVIARSATSAPRLRHVLDDVLDAAMAGDLATVAWLVDEAGGAEVFGEDAALIEALSTGHGHAVARDDVQGLARSIADDARGDAAKSEAPDGRRGEARGLLARLASSLGLGVAPRAAAAPVVLRPAQVEGSFVNTLPASSGLGVRGFMRDIFARETWQPRVDQLVTLVAPALTPGVYALQRKALGGDVALPELDEVRARLGAGRGLDAQTRRMVAERLAAVGRSIDLERLTIHDGAEADALCRELEAEAFALGDALVFRAGAFRPESMDGLHLLVHELTHVWQQAHGLVDVGVDADPALEREAEVMADRALTMPVEPIVATATIGVAAVEGVQSIAGELDAGGALQRCGPREMAAQDNPPHHDPKHDPNDPDPIVDPDPDPVIVDPVPDPIIVEPVDPGGECEACPEPDLAHATFEPLRELADKPVTVGQKKVELSLAGHTIKVEVPEAQAAGEIEVTFPPEASPFTALILKKAKLRFDDSLRVLDGEISAGVDLGKFVHVADTTLRVFEDGRIGAEIRGVEVNVADNVHALVDLVIGPEGVWGMCTVTADKVFVSDMVDVKNGLLHLRVDRSGAISMHGEVTVQVHGIGEADLEVCYVDGKWGGSIAIGRREELEIAPGVVLEEIMVTGCFAPDEWWVRGEIKVRVLDKFRLSANAKYHWKAGEGRWSFEGLLDQFEAMELGGEVELYDTRVYAKYDEGRWAPMTFQSRLRHPWVEGGIDEGTWDIEENLWSGHGYCTLTQQLPVGDSGITIDTARIDAYLVDNELTEIHGQAAATFPFQGEPTFELSCLDAVYKVKEESLWATANLRSIREIRFGDDTGFHAVIAEGAGVTALVEDSELTKTLGGLAFEARHAGNVLGDGGMYFSWVPGGGVDAGGRFDLRERFGLPDYGAGPLFLLPAPGHFEFKVIASEPQFIEAQGVGFEIAQAEGGLIGGEVSGRFDFATNAGDLSGHARVVRSWTEPLGDIGAVTFVESETPNLEVAIEDNALTTARGHLDVRLDMNATEHVAAFTLEGHVDGAYNPKTGAVSGSVGAALKTDLSVAIGDSGDRVIIREGSWFSANMIENVPDVFTMQLVVQYLRKGELFLEGACDEATFDLQTGELDFLGSLTLKQDIEKSLGQSGYTLALVKDVTNLAVVVRKNALISVGGDVAVELRDAEGPLLAGSLTRADYQIEEGLFSGHLDLALRRDLSWPKAADAASLPPTLAVTLGAGSHVHGEMVDNVFTDAGVELFGRVQYQGKEQAEAYLNGRWDVVADRYDLDGYFKLTNDLVLGDEAAADAGDMTAWTLVFAKDSQVTVGVVANVFQPVGVNVAMALRRGAETCATGAVDGAYVFGADGGFNGDVVFDVTSRIGLGRAGRFDIALSEETHAVGTIANNAFVQGAVDVVLIAAEGDVDKARLALSVPYAGGDTFSGTAELSVLDAIRLGERRMGASQYAVDLNTQTRALIGLEDNQLARFSGEVGLDVSRDGVPFAEGDLSLAYNFGDADAAVDASGELRLIGVLELGTVGPYTFALEGGSGLSGCIEDGGLAWIKGDLKLAASTAREGRFATLEIDGRYEGGTQPKFDGSAEATVHREHDLGFTAFGYGFFLQPSTGFSIALVASEFTTMHGEIGVLARQRSKKKDGMHGDVRMTLSGDAVKQGTGWKFDGHADASVEGGIRVGTAGDYDFSIETGSGIAIDVRANRFVSVEGTLNGKVTEKGKGFLGFDCWVRYAAAESENDPGVIDARGSCKLLGEKELYRNDGFAFSLTPTAGYTALIVVEKNEIMEVGGELGFRLENANAKPQPLKVSGTAAGHYDNTTKVFSGRGDIRLDSELVFEMGDNSIVLEAGSGGMTEIVDNRLARLGGTLIGRFDDADGPLVRLRASGEFNAETPELERLEGSATLLRELRLGPDGAPWIIVDKDMSCDVRMAHNVLTYASGRNGKFSVPALRLRGGFEHLTMNAEGPETKYSGAGFLELEMLKEDKAKGRKLNGRLDVDYREDDTWSARGTVDYDITPYLGGQITAEMDQTLDPVLGGTLVMTKKEMLPARDLFQMQFPIIPDMTIPVAGIAGFGFGARGYFGLSALPMTLSARVGVANFRPRQMNVPDFEAQADIDWGLRLNAGAMAYLDARLDVLIASASIGIQGTADLAGDALVKAKGKLTGKAGEYSGELGIGLVFAPKVTLKAQPYAKASLFDYEWSKVWDGYEYDLGEVFNYEWGSTYKFGDVAEAPKENSERNAAAMSGGARQDMTRSFDADSADSFGEERASPAVQASEGRPAMESGEDLKNKKEEEEADGMEGLKDDSKDASDIGSVMAAVGNIISQLGQILGSLTFGPIGLVLCLCWKWMSGALEKLYNDWCLVTDYIRNNWDKIKEYLPTWFVSFVDFMRNPASAIEKWWNADEYTREAVAAGEHLKAPYEVRGNMVGNLFGGYAADEDRRAIEEIFQVSKDKGDLVGVIVASEYKVISYPESWFRHDDWAGSRLQRIYLDMGWRVDPGYVYTDTNIYFDRDAAPDVGNERAHAAQGIAGAGGALPFGAEIQAAFGAHDVGGVAAHTDEGAREANAALGARAYALGEHVAFGEAPDLHTAAHEAAHVVQQRAGVSGATAAHEAHADAVADAVVAGESAEALLDAGVGAGGSNVVVQKKEDPAKEGEEGAEKEGDTGEEQWLTPKVTMQLVVTEVKDEPLDADVFGSVRPEYLVRDMSAHADGTRAHIAGVFELVLHWNVQDLGRKEARPAFATTAPETHADHAGKKVYEAMADDITPNALNFPAQRAYWSSAFAEKHERVHLEDYSKWAREAGHTLSQDAWEMGGYTAGELDAQVEEQRVETVKQLRFDAAKQLHGMPPLPYLMQPTEVNAFGRCATGLRLLAKMIREHGLALEAKERGDVTVVTGEEGASEDVVPHGKTLSEGADGAHNQVGGPGGGGGPGTGHGAMPMPVDVVPNITITRTIAQDATVPSKALGVANQDFVFGDVSVQVVAGALHVSVPLVAQYHWNVEGSRHIDVTPETANLAPEMRFKQMLGKPSYLAMAGDLMPRDNQHLASSQEVYWSKAHGIQHELFHVEDDWLWLTEIGEVLANIGWRDGLLIEAAPNAQPADIEKAALAAAPAVVKRITNDLNAGSNANYWGAPSEVEYVKRKGEQRAFAHCANGMMALAKAVYKRGQALEAAAKSADDAAQTALDGEGIDAEVGTAPAFVFGVEPLPLEISNQFYAHGGFMGAAPELVADPTWSRILLALMPDVAAAVSALVDELRATRTSDATRLIPMMENNPVMSAYGMWRTRQLDQQAAAKGEAANRVATLQAFEWDVFVQELFVFEYSKHERANKDGERAADLAHWAEVLVDTMIIGHGTRGQLIAENVFAFGQYGSVAGTDKTQYGGVMPAAWMDVFGRALKLAGAGAQFDTLFAETVLERERDLLAHAGVQQTEATRATFKDKLAITTVVDLYKTAFSKDAFSVMLDIKSTHLTASALQHMIAVLNRKGIHVLGVGSFQAAQLEGVDDVAQEVDGKAMKKAKAVRFFHVVQELQKAAATGELDGQHAMFNAACLLEPERSNPMKPSYSVRTAIVRELGRIVAARNVKVGLYVQESDISPEAVVVIEQMVRAEPTTFVLGFAWGGTSASAANIDAKWRKSRRGYGGQELFAHKASVAQWFYDLPLQKMAAGDAAPGDVHAHAATGVAGGGGALPFAGEIQAAFGAHDLSGVQAHVGGAAKQASAAIGASAYAMGEKVAFADAPDLHTAAHEAAHVVQQRQGVALSGGVGQAGDAYEQHADQVADAVVAGESAEALLGAVGAGGASAVQREANAQKPHPFGDPKRDALVPPLEDALAVMTEWVRRDVEEKAQRAALEGEGSLVIATAAGLMNTIQVGNQRWTMRLARYAEEHPGLPLRELLAAFQLANVDDMSDPHFRLIGEHLRGTPHRRRALVAARIDYPDSDWNAEPTGATFAGLVGAMGYEVVSRVPVVPHEFVAALTTAQQGLEAGDELVVFVACGIMGGSHDLMFLERRGPSLVERPVPMAMVQGALTRAKARGLHVTAVMDVAAGAQVMMEQAATVESAIPLASLPEVMRSDDDPPVFVRAVAALDVVRYGLATSTEAGPLLGDLVRQLGELGLTLAPVGGAAMTPERAIEIYGACARAVADARPREVEAPIADARPFEVLLAPDAVAQAPFVSVLNVAAMVARQTRPASGRVVVTLDALNPASPYAVTRERFWTRVAQIVDGVMKDLALAPTRAFLEPEENTALFTHNAEVYLAEDLAAALQASAGTLASGLGEPFAGLDGIAVEGLAWESREANEARLGHSATQIPFTIGGGLSIVLPWGHGRKMFGLRVRTTIVSDALLESRDVLGELRLDAALDSIGAKLIRAKIDAAAPGTGIDFTLATAEVDALLRPWTEHFWAAHGIALKEVVDTTVLSSEGTMRTAVKPHPGEVTGDESMMDGESSASIIASTGQHQLAYEGEQAIDGEHKSLGHFSGRMANELDGGKDSDLVDATEDIADTTQREGPSGSFGYLQIPNALRIGQYREHATDDGGPREKRSVHVGVASYHDAAISDLPGAANDANVMADRMKAKGFDATRRIDVTIADMRAAFAEGLDGLGRDDHLVITYSGHGYSQEALGVTGVDTQSSDAAPVYRWSEFVALASAALGKVVHIQIVIDACHAGNATAVLERDFEKGLEATLARATGRRLAATELYAVVREYVRYFTQHHATLNPLDEDRMRDLFIAFENLAGHPSTAVAPVSGASASGAHATLKQLEAELLALVGKLGREAKPESMREG